MTPTSPLSCFRSLVGGCYRHLPVVSTELRPLIIAAPSLFELLGMGRVCAGCAACAAHSRLHAQRACDQSDFLNPTPARCGCCTACCRSESCSDVLFGVTCSNPAPPVPSGHKHGAMERGGSVQRGRTGYNAAPPPTGHHRDTGHTGHQTVSAPGNLPQGAE